MKRNRRKCLILSGLLVTSLPVTASAGQGSSFDQLATALKPGDVVSVTQWPGREHKGRLADLTGCSIVLVTGARRVRIDASEVRVVKRLKGAEPAGGADRIADAGKACKEASCMAMSLAFSGGTALTRGFASIFSSRWKTVYRTQDQRPPSEVCRQHSATL